MWRSSFFTSSFVSSVSLIPQSCSNQCLHLEEGTSDLSTFIGGSDSKKKECRTSDNVWCLDYLAIHLYYDFPLLFDILSNNSFYLSTE